MRWPGGVSISRRAFSAPLLSIASLKTLYQQRSHEPGMLEMLHGQAAAAAHMDPHRFRH
ncbi:hypothetical protein D8I24_3083 (plasmid) [Cupriavidus necator H850]|nr:hypothetical protein D8I24_3083 [Cupriavidus necator H850]